MGVDGVGDRKGGTQQGAGSATITAAVKPKDDAAVDHNAKPATFNDLALETIAHIFTYLPIRDLARSECVSNQWKQLGKTEEQNRIDNIEHVNALFARAINEDTRSIEGIMRELTKEQQKCLETLKNLPPNHIGPAIQALRPEINKQTGNTDINPILQNIAIMNKIDDALLALILGADVDQVDPLGITPLYRAAFKGHAYIVKVLLGVGADVNKADTLKVTPLFAAAYNGHTKTVKALLAANADVNQLGFQETPALYWPAHNGHKEIVKALLEAGAGKDVNTANLVGETPLSAAALNDHAEIVDMLERAAQDRASY